MQNKHTDDLPAKFQAYHKRNPHIWAKFKELAFREIKKGRKRYGAKKIGEDMRADTKVRGDDGLKVNNSYISFYAHMFINCYPEHEGFFRLRQQKHEVAA